MSENQVQWFLTTMRWSDIPGARFDEHEEEGEE